MSVAALGFALGLGVMTPEAGQLDNPHLLKAERVYQELIYRHRRLLVQKSGVPGGRLSRLHMAPHMAEDQPASPSPASSDPDSPGPAVRMMPAGR